MRDQQILQMVIKEFLKIQKQNTIKNISNNNKLSNQLIFLSPQPDNIYFHLHIIHNKIFMF